MLAVISGDPFRRQHLVLDCLPLRMRADMIDLSIELDHQRMMRGLCHSLDETAALPFAESLAVAA